MNSYKELILVGIVISLLFLVGAASVSKGSAAWKANICTSNLKAIHQAAMSYSNDNNGETPIRIYKDPKRWIYWHSYIMKYVDSPRIFYCPANPKASKQFTNNEDNDDDLIPAVFDMSSASYGMNYAIGRSISPKKANKAVAKYNVRAIADPAHLVYFGDSKTAELRGTKWCWKTDYAPVHEGRQLIVFADGHVESMGKDNLGMTSAFDGWKKDPQRWTNWKKDWK